MGSHGITCHPAEVIFPEVIFTTLSLGVRERVVRVVIIIIIIIKI